jgi:WD40 repeat protein
MSPMLQSCFAVLILTATAAAQDKSAPPPPPPKIVDVFHSGTWLAVAFSPDGKTLATGGDDKCIRLWDAATGNATKAILAHPGAVSRIAYFPDGKKFASAGWLGSGGVCLWDAEKGTLLKTIGNESGGIPALAVSPDGRTVAWGETHLYDVVAEKETRLLPAPTSLEWIAFSPNGKLLATACNNTKVRIWDPATGQILHEILAWQTSATGSQSIAFSSDSKIMATTGKKADVTLWNVANFQALGTLEVKGNHVLSVAISPDDRYIATGTELSLQVWNLATRKLLHAWDRSTRNLAFSKNGRRLAAASGLGGSVALIDLEPAAK